MLRASLGEVPWWWALGGVLLGSALSDTAPGTMPVATPAGTLPIGDITLPIALAVGLVRIGAGMGALGAGIAALREWRPRLIIEHIHATPPGET